MESTTAIAKTDGPPNGLDPSLIMQVGMGFWASKALLSAVELELFTRLGAESMTGEEIGVSSGA
jgi:hypothetical protein